MGAVRLLGAVRSAAALPRFFAARRREQWLSGEALEALSVARLAWLLEQAAAAAYYRELFATLRIRAGEPVREVLLRLPLLDKQRIAAVGVDALLCVPRERLFPVTTSGSTGTPGVFFRSPLEEADCSARWWRVYAAFGCSLRDTQLNLASGFARRRTGALTLLRMLGVVPAVHSLPAGAPPAQALAVLNRLRPRILTGYAAALEALAGHILDTGAPAHRPRVAVCTSMEVTDHCREIVMQAFGCPVVNVYVTNELGVIAWSCPMRPEVLHVNEDTCLVEVLDERGEAVPPGISGELVLTPLTLTAMPLLRYRIGDIAARLAERCACGRGLGLITAVQGRTAHCIVARDGLRISSAFVAAAVGNCGAYAWVRRWQLREEVRGQLCLLVETRRPPRSNEEAELLAALRGLFGESARVTLQITAAIPLAPSGKFQLIVPCAPAGSQAA